MTSKGHIYIVYSTVHNSKLNALIKVSFVLKYPYYAIFKVSSYVL